MSRQSALASKSHHHRPFRHIEAPSCMLLGTSQPYSVAHPKQYRLHITHKAIGRLGAYPAANSCMQTCKAVISSFLFFSTLSIFICAVSSSSCPFFSKESIFTCAAYSTSSLFISKLDIFHCATSSSSPFFFSKVSIIPCAVSSASRPFLFCKSNSACRAMSPLYCHSCDNAQQPSDRTSFIDQHHCQE